MRIPGLSKPIYLRKKLETERLHLRQANGGDAPFVLQLLNDPAWLRFIGDRNIKTLEDARYYINEILIPTYTKFGFGLYLVELKQTSEPIGLCGLVKRDALEDVDIGFAFLPRYWHQGYAYESARAVIQHGRKVFALRRLLAITTPDNGSSIRLLEKLGFQFERMVHFEKSDLRLYVKLL